MSTKSKKSFLRKKPMEGAGSRAVNFGIGTGATVGAAYLMNKVIPDSINPKIKGIGALAVGLAGSVFVENDMVRAATDGVGHYGGLYLTGEMIPSQKANFGLSGPAGEISGLGNQDWDEMARLAKEAEDKALEGLNNPENPDETENFEGIGADKNHFQNLM